MPFASVIVWNSHLIPTCVVSLLSRPHNTNKYILWLEYHYGSTELLLTLAQGFLKITSWSGCEQIYIEKITYLLQLKYY
jgi:hypothetical protein